MKDTYKKRIKLDLENEEHDDLIKLYEEGNIAKDMADSLIRDDKTERAERYFIKSHRIYMKAWKKMYELFPELDNSVSVLYKWVTNEIVVEFEKELTK